MFNEIILGGTPKRAIPLATRLGLAIENEVRLPITTEELEKANQLHRNQGRDWRVRAAPTTAYNCAGHVWASRRASIYTRTEWERILREDGYSKLNEGQAPLPGDLVIYKLPNHGIIHIGEVLFLEGDLRVPNVLSKWSDWSGEFIHKFHDVPFRVQFPDFLWEYWTERLRAPLP